MVRLYDSLLDDPKVQQLPARLFRLYINCLCLANKGEPRGAMGTTVEVAFRMRLPWPPPSAIFTSSGHETFGLPTVGRRGSSAATTNLKRRGGKEST